MNVLSVITIVRIVEQLNTSLMIYMKMSLKDVKNTVLLVLLMINLFLFVLNVPLNVMNVLLLVLTVKILTELLKMNVNVRMVPLILLEDYVTPVNLNVKLVPTTDTVLNVKIPLETYLIVYVLMDNGITKELVLIVMMIVLLVKTKKNVLHA